MQYPTISRPSRKNQAPGEKQRKIKNKNMRDFSQVFLRNHGLVLKDKKIQAPKKSGARESLFLLPLIRPARCSVYLHSSVFCHRNCEKSAQFG